MVSQQSAFNELGVSPGGHLVPFESGEAAEMTPQARRAVKAFLASPAEGLIALAALSSQQAIPPSLAFWQGFARRYVALLCQTPQFERGKIEPIPALSNEELEKTAAGAPPMRGAEYLCAEVLAAIWNDLDAWVQSQISRDKEGLAGFLKAHAPNWRQVGRVCFHLAENKRDELYPFAFLATYIPGLSGQDRAKYQPLGKALQQYAGEENKAALVRLLSPVQSAAEKSPFVQELVASGDLFHPLAWTPQEAHCFLKEAPLYEESGILVRLPDWWQKRSRPQVGVSIGNTKQTSLGSDTLLDFKVQMALGEEVLTQEEWEELLAGDDGLTQIKGRWVEVDREKLTAALDHWKQVEAASQSGELSFIEGMRLLAGASATLAGDESPVAEEWSFVKAGSWLRETLEQLRGQSSNGKTKAIKGLQATLRHYQQAGVEWLRLTTSLGLGACLADDMGLGKTIQVLALLQLKKEQDQKSKPSLLVLPATLLGNWKAEMARFTPALSAIFVHSSESDKQSLKKLQESPQQSLQGIDLVLTTYGMLQRQEWLKAVEWKLVVLDEAQAIKNPGARQTKAVKNLKAETRLALTGTPVENRLSDLWSLFDFLCPGLLGSAEKFKKFVKSLEKREHDRYAPLRNLVRPYILRRLKTDKSIIADLPEKSEVKAYCGLSKRQAVLYQAAVDNLSQAMKGGLEGIKRSGVVLASLMQFKQICNHPSQFVGDGEYQQGQSGKFLRLAEICEEIASRQEKVLVFTQFREMTAPLHDALAAIFQQPGLILHGGTAVGKRKKLVESFAKEGGPPFFVLSLKAGGTGLNLTAASHVIHFDRWWNPAVENQATDRAFRIGQKRNVLVHKFVCRGTIEEQIDNLIDEKKELANDLLAGGAEKILTELSDQQLMDLVSLDLNKAAI